MLSRRLCESHVAAVGVSLCHRWYCVSISKGPLLVYHLSLSENTSEFK